MLAEQGIGTEKFFRTFGEEIKFENAIPKFNFFGIDLLTYGHHLERQIRSSTWFPRP